MASAEVDAASQLLIAQLIEEDIQLLRHTNEAETLQLEQAIAVSAHKANRIPKRAKVDHSDGLVLDIYAEEARKAADASIAESLQQANRAAIFSDQLLAQKLAAEERKLALDAALSRRLQEIDDEGKDIDSYVDVESILSQDVINAILSPRPTPANTEEKPIIDKGKGKATIFKEETPDIDETLFDDDHDNEKLPYAKCGICLEPFQPTHAPVKAALTANSSARVPFGLNLPCPSNHGYCISCLTHYIQSKLDPDGSGKSNSDMLVFPIRCPECPAMDWPLGIEDSVAERVLDAASIAVWHHQRLLDSIPRLYCPNPQCSALVEANDDPDEPQAVCPYCSGVMCVQCRVQWHENLTCEQYQELPPDERSKEDQLLFELARAKNWRRCPRCAVVVELTHGCNHITCRCGFHFCFKCGSSWDVKNVKCTKVPSCKLWDDENMLLDEPERQRRQVGGDSDSESDDSNAMDEDQRPAGIPYGTFDWMDDPTVVCSRHYFTTSMIQDLRCGYCYTLLNSLADLKGHLLHVRRHPVYACCGKIFKRKIDYERHRESEVYRFGGMHVHQYQMD